MESPVNWTYRYFREQDYTQNTHLNTYGQMLASAELARYLACAVDDLRLYDYTSPEIEISDFLDSALPSNNLLIIDDCPKPINAKINPDIAERLESFGINLKKQDKGEEDGPAIYMLSNGKIFGRLHTAGRFRI